jgi:hypothetical protein
MMDYLNDFHRNNVESEFDSFIIIQGRNEDEDDLDIMLEFDSEDNRLYIDKSFLDTFAMLFPLDIEDSQEFIKDWFEWKFGVEIKYTQS